MRRNRACQPRGSSPWGRVLVGTSGWQYRDWRGTFYPAGVPQRRWLEHYASRFATVENNGTFYRLPRPVPSHLSFVYPYAGKAIPEPVSLTW